MFLALWIIWKSLSLQTHYSPFRITTVLKTSHANSTSLFLVETMSSRKDWSSAQESISVRSYSTVVKGPKDQRLCFRLCMRYWNIWGEKKGIKDYRSLPVNICSHCKYTEIVKILHYKIFSFNLAVVLTSLSSNSLRMGRAFFLIHLIISLCLK